MKKWTLTIKFILLIQIFSAGIFAQIAPNRYWIQFSDKIKSPYSITNPETFISERSINRRLQQSISIDTTDLPVNPAYVDSLRNLGLTIISTSKWLNGAIVETYNGSLISQALKFTFVSNSPFFSSELKTERISPEKLNLEQKSAHGPTYGASANQIEMLNGDYLHNKNYLGQEMLITVLDAGFNNSDIISSLQHLWDDSKVIATYDFVKDESSFFETYQHGTVVLTAMAGIENDVIYGTAPEANYLLVRTEKQPSEFLIEEYNWVCGAEFADSLGTDVINSSLGYTEFDDIRQNHIYSDMDGKTNISAIGASMASSKGILVVASAGNEGDNLWFRIGSPADADGIISVGAVDPDGVITKFSSRGPSSDGRVKPEVCAQGLDVIVQNQSGEFVESSGTSLSSPLIAGMAACLWQANQNATNLQVIEAIKQSSSHFYKSDSIYGFGIPDFGKADRILKNILLPQGSLSFSFFSYPNPVKDFLSIEIYQNEFDKPHRGIIAIYDLTGRIMKESLITMVSEISFFDLDLTILSSGVYNLSINIEGRVYSSVFIKE